MPGTALTAADSAVAPGPRPITSMVNPRAATPASSSARLCATSRPIQTSARPPAAGFRTGRALTGRASARRSRRSRGSVGDQVYVAGPPQPFAHRGNRRRRDRHAALPPVGQPGYRSFEQAADPGHPSREVHPELGGVDVMHHAQHRHAPRQRKRGEERDAILAVHDDIGPAAVRDQPAERARVHGEPPAAPDDLDPVAMLAACLPGRARGQEADHGSPLRQCTRHLPCVTLRAAGLRMPGIAPVGDDDAHATHVNRCRRVLRRVRQERSRGRRTVIGSVPRRRAGADPHGFCGAEPPGRQRMLGGKPQPASWRVRRAAIRDCSQIDPRSRNTAAEWRRAENVEPAMSRHWTGISVTVAPSCKQVASSSTSKANPAVRRGRTAALASGPAKNLNPHWVSAVPGRIQRATIRNRAAPAQRSALDRALDNRPVHAARSNDEGMSGGEEADGIVEG